MCNPCYQYAHHHNIGVCATCKRQVAVYEGVCRLCRIQASLVPKPYRESTDLSVAARTGHQLFLYLTMPALPLDAPPPLPMRPTPGPSLLPWRPPAWRQLRWCDPPRDMTRVRITASGPVDPGFAAYLRGELDRHASLRGWQRWMHDRASWTVGLLARVHPGDAPIKASTVLSFAGTTTSYSITRVLAFLAGLGLLDDDRPDVLGGWITARLADVHPAIRAETDAWISILRHGGPRRHPRAEATIRQKIDYIAPFLLDISTRHASLREVTATEITAWLQGRRAAAHQLLAIRDLFKTLHQQRIVFTNPTRDLHPGSAPKTIPTPITPDALQAIAHAAAADPALHMTVALIGVHGLYPHQARQLPLDAIDLHNGRLAYDHRNRPLDEFTRNAATGYLAHRHRRWPTTTNPYLLVNHITAHSIQPVSSRWMLHLFADLPVTPWQLREDRLLEEAAHADGDPLHLAAMFGLGPQASLRYTTAWPLRQRRSEPADELSQGRGVPSIPALPCIEDASGSTPAGKERRMGTEEVLAEQVAYYRARAPEYDDWWERRGGYDLGEQVTRAWRADAALLRDAFAPRGQVLELAAGTGIWTGELLRHADRVLAVDAAPEALAINRAKHHGHPVDYAVVDLFSWTPPRRFDAVCFGFWLSHVPAARWARFWALVDRALAPGGRVWFCDSAHPEHSAAHGPPAVRDRGDVEPAGDRRQRQLHDGRAFQIIKRYWHPQELEAELAAFGWHAVVRNTPWAFIYGTTTRVEEHPDST
jgi:SAM-dependent methyltransferase